MLKDIILREMEEGDCERFAKAFLPPRLSYRKNLAVWKKYFKEHRKGLRTVCLLLTPKNRPVGYGSLLRSSGYPYFRKNRIPEVHAVWIDGRMRRKGLGTRLISHLEEMARKEGCKQVGIGVGLYRDYGPAQNLYFSRLGYKPDCRGITYKCRRVVPGKKYPVDDDLILWLTKSFT